MVFSNKKSVLRSLDEMLIMSQPIEQHFENLRQICSTLKKFNITLNFKNCNFAQVEAKFLGNILTPQGITRDPEKLDKIRNFKEARNLK